MRWKGRRTSRNIEDRRGQGAPRRGRGKALGGGSMIILLLIGLFFGQDVSNLLAPLLSNNPSSYQETQQHRPAKNDEAAEFVSVILAETEDTWNIVFRQLGREYQPPKLVLYRDSVRSACGISSSQSGPFYCPGDYKIYIDLSFLDDLQRMGAPGDFAFAYVIAHEVGHHIQNLVGIARDVREQQARSSKVGANALSVKMELQADCLAGVWINHTEKRSRLLEEGDIEEGLAAAAAVGDDRILKQAGRSVNREAFTHGSSRERMYWFQQGMRNGDIQSCNTFS